MAILLVEDDVLLGDGIKAALTQAGSVVDWAEDGRKAQWALPGYRLFRVRAL